MQRSSKTVQNAGCVKDYGCVHIMLIFRAKKFTFSSHLVEEISTHKHYQILDLGGYINTSKFIEIEGVIFSN